MLSRLAIILVILISCHSYKTLVKKESTQQEVDNAALNYEKGIIRFTELDGCRFLIHLEGGKKLQPDKILPMFEKDSLKVWVKYKPENRMNICMSGITVNMIDIKLREE